MKKFLLTLLTALITISVSWAQSSNFSYGFEAAPGPDDWDDNIMVASGTNSITAATGAFYGQLPGANLDFTRFGGYNSVFPCNGYKASIKIYLDVDGGYANDTRFDYSVASSGSDGGHERDFIFSVGFYNDGVAPGAGNRFVASASNNSPGWPADPGRSPQVIATTSGWYTLEHSFEDNAGVLEVVMKIYDPSNAEVGSWTLSNPADLIPSVVGGNRYGWFPSLGFTSLAIDDVNLTPNPGNLPTAFTDFETFNTGTVNYQGPGCTVVTSAPYNYTIPNPYGSLWTVTDEWGTAPSSFDQEVQDDGTGNMVWRVSNAVTTSGYSNLPNSPSSLLVAGESTAALYNDRGPDHTSPAPPNPRESASTPSFHTGFRFKSATGAAQAGLFISLNPTPRQSSIRMSYVGIEDVGTGFDLNFYETSPGSSFDETIIASNLSYTDWHEIDIYIEFVDGLGPGGAGNDIVVVELDGNIIHIGTSWESYYAENPGPFPNAPYAVDALMFRISGTAAPGTSGNGFYIDDVVYDNALLPPGPVKLYTDNTLTTLISTHYNIQEAVDAAVSGNAITADAGTYNERVVIDKSLTLRGADESTVILDGTGLGDGRGIAINNGVTNVTIETLTVQNFSGVNGNTSAGIYAIGGNNGLSIEHVTIQNNVGGSGFYANGPVDGITLDYVTSSGHTVGARGIVIWNGLKDNITITNCEVFNNNCCGIELQDGTSSGVNISNNNVYNNGDNGLGIVGMQGPGVNIVSGNTVTDNGRFGLEIKNPDGSGATSGAGSIVVENNNVSLTAPIADLRDLAGIAVMRRGVLAGNVDLPTGVVVRNNTVSGYQQGSDSDGFGIVIGGNNHTVENNDVSNSDVGIQQQAGHTPYPGDGDQNNIVDDYFGRDNSPATCGNTVTGNTFSGNGVDERNVGAGSGFVTNTDTGEMFCSIQAAISDADTQNGHTITVDPGTYEEDVNVNKSVTLQGAGIDITTVIGQIGGDGATFRVAASGVTIDGFTITRAGNNTTDWNNGGLNFAGIAIQGQANDAEIRNCKIIGNRTGIDINNSNDNNIHNNVITFNRTGLLFRNQTDNTILVENEITDSWTMGILFLDASGGDNIPVQSALNSTFNENNISGNWYGQIVDRQAGGSLPTPGTTNLKNFECNWFGSTTPVVSTMDSAEPGYSSAIPVAYGGSAVPPGGQPDILGPGSANFEYILYLIDGTDDEAGTPGFQPVPLSCAGGCSSGLVTNTNTGEIFCTIQAAIDDTDTQNGHTLVVGAGTYVEDIIVDKSLVINGPNAGISPNTGVRVAEAIIHPLTSDPFGEIIKIQASDVTVDGFTIDGDNPDSTSTYLGVNGADLDAAEAITVYVDNINNLNVSNNIIENLTYFGVTVFGASFSSPTTSGHVVNDNLFQNLGTYDAASGIDSWGGGVLIYNDQYTAITNNTMTGVRIGVQTGNFHDPNTGSAAFQMMDGNTISSRRLGIFYNLHTGAGVSSYTLSNNTISAEADANETRWTGISMASQSNASGFATDNDIDGSAITHNNAEGYSVWNVKNDAPAIISGGTVTGVDVGVFVNNYEGYSSDAGDGAHANISGVNINASDTGIRVLDSPNSTSHADVQATVNNCFITGGTDGVKLEETVASAVTGTINNNSITGQSGNTINATTISNTVDATCNWYGTTVYADIAASISGAVDFVPYLNDGTDDDALIAGFQPVAGSCVGAPVQVYSDAAQTTFVSGHTTIQAAIDAGTTLDGYFVQVDPGNYQENVTINKSLTLRGPNADIACGSRGAEAIIAPTSGLSFTVTADDVTINGFEITAPDSPNGISFSNTSNVSILFNNIHDIGTSVTNTNVHAIVYNVGSGAYTSASITDNCFDNISSTALSGWSASAIGILQSPSTGVLTGLNIERNTINDVEVNTGNWPTGKIAYGIQINVGGGGSYLTTSGEVVNAVIRNNEITNLSGFISTGIGLEGNTKDAVVENNAVSGLYGRKFSGDRAGGAYDLSALKFENNRWVSTVTVQNNSFQVNTFTHDATPGLGYAVSNYVPAGTAFSGGGGGTTGEATISCNWLGTSINGDILDNGSFTGKIFNKDNCVTNFVPFLVDDTDDAPGMVGFQPAPLACIGGPVQVYDGNTFIAVYTEIQTAIDDATTLSGHTVRIAAGTYVENVDAVTLGKSLTFAPGASPGCVTIDGNFTLDAGDALEIEIEGTTACTEHDQFIVTGTVDLGGATLITPLGMYLAQPGDEIVIIDGSSTINGTFAEGNFVTDGTNTYYINYVAGIDGFDVVLTKCCNGLLDLGIFNYAETSPVGNKVQVFVRPNIDVVNGAYSAGVFTIRTLTSNAVTFTKLGAPSPSALSPFDYNQVGTATDGGYTYYFFSYEAVNNVDWTAGNEYLLLTLGYDCIGDAIIELTNDAFTMANNGDYYQELGAAEAHGIFYEPTATSPTSVSITADNNGTLCATADIDLSSMTLDGTAPYTYAWSGPDGYTSTDADPAPFASTLTSGGTYTVTVTDANGCTATATTEVIVLDNAGCVENVTLTTFYPTITEAIDAPETLDDHIIRVPAANWPENVIVNKALTIIGANVGIPCDDPGRVAESVILGTTAVTISSDGVTIDGFTMEAITGISSTGFVDVSLVNNKINAKQFGITTSVVTTSATDGYTVQDNCIDFCDQVFDAEGFAVSPTLSATQAAGAWYTDRYSPAGFIAEMFGGDSRLKHSIADTDCQSCRPASFSSAFYNTQGRKYDISGTTAMSIELYVPASWATTDRRMAGFWGTALDASNDTRFPIIEFTSDNGTPRFRGWDNGVWVDLGLPTGFVYDEWYTLEIALLSSDEFMYSVGDKSLSVPALGSVTIDNVILQGHNTDTPGVTYDIYWDNFSTFCAPVAMNAPTVGINLVGANGSDAVVLQDNSVSNGFYGYVMAGVTTADRTTVRGGEYTDIMQGVAVVNTLDGVTYLPSTVGVADLSMTSFSGDYPALPAFNFHSGVYTFTGGADVAAIVDVAIDNVTVSNTGKPQQNSAGIHFADFSTGADPRLTATVTNSVISDNLNRGVQIRGGNASAIVSDSDILGNGSDPFGAGGNDGFGVYAGVGSQIELYNNNIVNPATQAGAFPVTAIFNGVAPASTIIANNNNIDDNSNGDVTHNTFDISFFDATCNWWGSSDVDDIDALVEGNVFFLPYLDDGTDDQPAMVGFQTSANCINPTAWYVNDNAQIDDVFTQDVGNDSNPGTKRRPFLTIGKAVMTVENNTSTGPDDNSIFVDAGSYDEQVVVPNTVGNLTLQGVGACDAVAPALTTLIDFTGTVTGKPTIFDIAGDGTVIDGIQFNVDLTKLNSAIIASHSSLDNITVQNNCIDPYQSTPGTNFGSYGNRNAIGINYAGYRVATGGVDNIFVDNNRVTATVNGIVLGDDAGDIAFRSAVSVDEGAGTYTRNVFQSINHDVLVRFNSNGDVVIGGSGADANTFNGGGVQYSDPNAAAGAVTISHNAFDGSVSGSLLRLQNNYHNASATVSDNTFSNLRWGVSLENFNNVTVADNTFSPLAGFNDFRHITVNTKSISGNSAMIDQVPIDGTFTGNTFNAGVAGNGTAMAFYNHDSDDAVLGSFTVGTAGSPNVFAPGFLYAVYLGDQLGSTLAAIGDFPEYNLGAGSDTEMACWDRDIDVQNNSFDVGSGPQLPPDMNNAERLALEVILYHLPDNACLGELIYFEAVLVEAKVFLQGPYDSLTGLMNDNLRTGGLIPIMEPFSSINTAHPGSFEEVNNFVSETITAPVLAVSGDDAIVDWVWLELRDMSDPNTKVATRSALVQRDGDIVDLDGISAVEFPDTYVGQYYLLVRHRNHLGAMTANPVDFTTVMPIDFTVAAEPTFGATPTSARRLVMTGTYGLWAGNTEPYPSVLAGFNVKYNGGSNDRLPILITVGDMTPLNILSGVYRLEDVNMDGQVKYNGSKNDRVIILQNVGPGSPLNVITQEPNN